MARTAKKSGASARKPAAGKAAARKTGAAKPADAAPAAPEPVVVAAAAPVVQAAALAKRELVEQAVERSGVKKKDAKPVVEAVLALLGEAVAEGRELNLKPFGKLRVNRSQERGNGRVFVCRLRQPQTVEGTANAGAEENT
ncbi:HU family DNA-binding protein [Leisingera aquaemixtae]|uniref:HU family DNA-binding protein n=1 Tax=Leisingera aquaemixtae TaxID=1396826 RepID=UPI001C950809|nr:HU family DNA-binding protein [Leisingera aquaemixtae]MBY6065257.1 HU family DNA-binding protein [Leisingera aquaemixtae]